VTAGTEGGRDALAKVSVALSLAECVNGRNLIIEAVPDYADIKGGVFREAIQHCAKDAVLTTNTLSVTLQEICVRSPSRVPPRRSVSVGVIRCALTSVPVFLYLGLSAT
jgi:3-hydroxyacyl-CoA dehydrogenase